MFLHRVGLSAGWRRQRYWSRQSCSCRALPSGTTQELLLLLDLEEEDVMEVEEEVAENVVVEAENTPSKMASPPACRELLTSWDLKVKACGWEPPWTPPSAAVCLAQTWTLQPCTAVPGSPPPPDPPAPSHTPRPSYVCSGRSLSTGCRPSAWTDTVTLTGLCPSTRGVLGTPTRFREDRM